MIKITWKEYKKIMKESIIDFLPVFLIIGFKLFFGKRVIDDLRSEKK